MKQDADTAAKPEVDTQRVDWRELAQRCVEAYFVMWAGITIAGTLFGAILFLVGAIVGFVLADITGAFTSLLGVLLHFALRGRLPLRVAASFAGATAGIFSWAFLHLGAPPSDAVVNLPSDFFPLYLITAPMGAIGGVIATSMLLRRLGRAELGRPMRSGQFSLADMMLLTAWLAVVMTLCRLLVAPAPPGSYRDLMLGATVLLAMAVAEGAYRLRPEGPVSVRQRRSGFSMLPPDNAEAAEIEAFWRRYDQQTARQPDKEELHDDPRSP